MEQNLWNLANIITGFAIAQSLAFLYALAKSEFVKAVDNPMTYWIICIAIIVASILYCVAVYFVGNKGASLTDIHNVDIWKSITLGRVAAILVFNAFAIVVITIVRFSH
jgi:hypothetical protein